MTKLFFATDVHGSEICWKKFVNGGKFYEVDVLILGGDMTGKAIVPIIAQGGGKYKVTLLEQEVILEDQAAVDEMVKTIQNRGYYPYQTSPEEVNELSKDPSRLDGLFAQECRKTVRRWMEYADAKLDGTNMTLYVCPGNDDIFEIDEDIASAKHVKLAEGRVIQLDDHHEMASSGWSNITPWKTHREEPDENLLQRLEKVIGQVKNPAQAIFNLHPPPYGSGLDEAPELTDDLHVVSAGRSMIPVGSRSVLEVIKKYKPLLGLHGHIHEGKGTRKLDRTLCINPGSNYEQGILSGAVVELKKDKVGNYILTTG
jgi:Icc-related predicted phosphoesterase